MRAALIPLKISLVGTKVNDAMTQATRVLLTPSYHRRLSRLAAITFWQFFALQKIQICRQCRSFFYRADSHHTLHSAAKEGFFFEIYTAFFPSCRNTLWLSYRQFWVALHEVLTPVLAYHFQILFESIFFPAISCAKFLLSCRKSIGVCERKLAYKYCFPVCWLCLIIH